MTATKGTGVASSRARRTTGRAESSASSDSGARARTLHLVGNSHIDPVWLWPWQEGFQAVRATFRSALDRMKEYPEFIFTADSAAYYEWVEQSDPEMFEEIRQRVAEGRWEIVGGWWVEPDCNLPSGEAFVRHGLYSQRYFAEHFGVTATVGYNVDPFGHNGMLPQILRGTGMDAYVFMRPQPHELELPGRVFWWESPDGSRVCAYRLPFEYTSPTDDLRDHLGKVLADLEPWPLPQMMAFFGVGNHGGGPTKANLESIRGLDRQPDLPHLVVSSPRRFFDAIAPESLDLPTWRGELQHHGVGCYAAHSGVKHWNRRAENALEVAERLATVATLHAGQPYPEGIDRAWKDVLFDQFHDILAGTSIEPSYEDARDLYGEALAIAARAQNLAVQAFARRVPIPEEPLVRPFLVFNPHAWPVRTNVELEFLKVLPGDRLLDERREEIDAQTTQPLATVGGSRNRLSFVADLPALGYRLYRLAPDPEQVARLAGSSSGVVATTSGPGSIALGTAGAEGRRIEASDHHIETSRVRLEIDPDTGAIARLVDKRSGLEAFAGPAARPVVLDDPSDTWGHDVLRYSEVVGAFRPVDIRLVEQGPVRAAIRVESEYRTSRLVQRFVLYEDLDELDVHVILDWRERRRMLKLRFPVAVEDPVATFEIPYGHIERPPNGGEEPGQTWVAVTGRAADGSTRGVGVVNDAKYSYDVDGADIGLTVVRSPIYAHHVPRLPDQGGYYSYMDQGQQGFSYSIAAHAGDWRDGGVVRTARVLNQRPITLLDSFHDGDLPQVASFVSIDHQAVIVDVIKQAEDGDDIVVRAHESFGQPADATIDFPHWGRRITASFGPSQIRTWRLPRDGGEAIPTDMLERPLERD